MGLEEVARVEVGREVGCDELFVLSTGLQRRGPLALRQDGGNPGLTTTVPLPQRPFQ